jgi:hypothetical protein
MNRAVGIAAFTFLLCGVVVGSVLLQTPSTPTDIEELNVITEEARSSLVYHDIFIVDMMSMQPTFVTNDIVFIRHVNATNVDTDDIIAIYSPFGDNRILLRRVIEKSETHEGLMFRTKGDGYLDRDPWILYESQIIGLIIAYQRDNVVTVIVD